MSARPDSPSSKTQNISNRRNSDEKALQRQSLTSAATITTTTLNDLKAKQSSPSHRRGTAVPFPSDIVDLTLSVVGDDTQGHEDVTGEEEEG